MTVFSQLHRILHLRVERFIIKDVLELYVDFIWTVTQQY